MTVTNVPGPQFPLYMAGSQMLATYPLVPLWESHGVGVAMFSINGRIDIGINMDRTLIEHPSVFGECLDDSFAELVDSPKQKPKTKSSNKTKSASKTKSANKTNSSNTPKAETKAQAKKAPPMGTR